MNELEILYRKLILRSGKLSDSVANEVTDELNKFTNDGKAEILKNLEITTLNKVFTSSFERKYLEVCIVIKKILDDKDRLTEVYH